VTCSLEYPNTERPKIDHVTNLVDHLHDINNYACQHLKLASDRMRIHYDRLANCVGYHEGDNMCSIAHLHKAKSFKLQCSWEGLYKVVPWKNDVAYRIQWNPRSRLTVVHLDQLVPYQGAAPDERP
jgi:hypothetical protein